MRSWMLLSLVAVAAIAAVSGAGLKCTKPMDILFLIDKSASIKKDQWKIEKMFVRKLIGKFAVGPSQMKAAIVLFANKARPYFCFNKHSTSAALDKAVAGLGCKKCKKGKTGTGKALRHGRSKSFTPECGARKNAARVVVVLTDGRSTEKAQFLRNQANAMKKVAGHVIAIGVGTEKRVDRKELQLIATSNSLVFTSNSFDSLLGIADKISKSICDVVKPVPATPTLTCEPGPVVAGTPQTLTCATISKGAANYTFFKDGEPVQTGSSNILKIPAVGSGDVGAYSCNVVIGGETSAESNEHKLDILAPATPILTAGPPESLVFGGTHVNMTCATATKGNIHYAFFKDGKEIQKGPLDKLFIPGAGPADVASYSCKAILGGKISAGSNVHKLELKVPEPPQLSGCPEKSIESGTPVTMTCATPTKGDITYEFLRDGVSVQKGGSNKLIIPAAAGEDVGIYTCKAIIGGQSAGSNSQKLGVLGVCNVPLDLLLLVDKSASINKNQWALSKKFLGELVDFFHISEKGVHVSLTLFAIKSHEIFCFNEYKNSADAKKAMAALSCPKCLRGKTGTGSALQWGREQSFTARCGARPGVKKIVVMITDGESTEPKDYLETQAKLMKETGAHVITVGVGHAMTKAKAQAELKMIASSDKNVFMANNFHKLQEMMETISKATCELGA